MKCQTTKKGAPRNCITATKAWTKAWKDLEQWQIQRWIEQIPRHIQKIIELHGGNEYQEGRMDGDSRPRKTNRRRAVALDPAGQARQNPEPLGATPAPSPSPATSSPGTASAPSPGSAQPPPSPSCPGATSPPSSDSAVPPSPSLSTSSSLEPSPPSPPKRR